MFEKRAANFDLGALKDIGIDDITKEILAVYMALHEFGHYNFFKNILNGNLKKYRRLVSIEKGMFDNFRDEFTEDIYGRKVYDIIVMRKYRNMEHEVNADAFALKYVSLVSWTLGLL